MTDLEAVQAIEEHWPSALQDRDRAWLEAHTTDKFMCVQPDGVLDRTQYLDHREIGNDTIVDGRNVVERIEIVGDTALLVNRAQFLVRSADGTQRDVRIRGSNVYLRIDGAWRVALIHLSEHPAGSPGWGEPLIDVSPRPLAG